MNNLLLQYYINKPCLYLLIWNICFPFSWLYIVVSIVSATNDLVFKHYQRIVDVEAENEKQYSNFTLLQTNVEGNKLVQL